MAQCTKPTRAVGQVNVEFIGGPFDGAKYDLVCRSQELVDVALLPLDRCRVNRSSANARTADTPRGAATGSSDRVAIYEREERASLVLYQYVGCVALSSPKFFD